MESSFISVQFSKKVKMAIFLVDLQFREKAKQMLSSKEIFAVLLFLMFALLPWVEIMETAQVRIRKSNL